jgi:hypothetical protein
MCAPPASDDHVISFCRRVMIGFPNTPKEHFDEIIAELADFVGELRPSDPALVLAHRMLKTERQSTFAPVCYEVVAYIKKAQEKIAEFGDSVNFFPCRVRYHRKQIARRQDEAEKFEKRNSK